MDQNISKTRKIVSRFIARHFPELVENPIQLHAEWIKTITRADGSIEQSVIPENIVVAEGLNQLATLGITNGNSAFLYLAIGTVTAQHSLGSTSLQFGEISRKTPAVIGTSKDLMIMVMTWAGNADSITGVALGSAAMVNAANSGIGTALNLTNSINATLQASDFLNLEVRVRVGSHNI